MREKIDGLTMDIAAAEQGKLRAVFPQCFVDGKLDEHKLLEILGTFDTLDENDREKYEFRWKGKQEALQLAGKRSTGTLRPYPDESLDWDNTRNIYIEGDNLEVLKLLQISYYRRVKMIYIDPPYNTGNDFVYADDFADPLARYREVTRQTTKSNPESMGRFHTNWLNMMLPRLRLAANLLRDDGVIFISIDDGEAYNLRKLCDEVFGEENFAADIIWQKVYSPRMDVQGFSVSHDHIFCYVRQSYDSIKKETFSQNAGQFNLVDATIGKNYRRRSVRKEGSHSTRSERPNLWFPLTSPDGTEVYPVKPDGTEGCWRWSKETYNTNLANDMVEWVKTENGWQVYAKQFLDEEATRPPQTLWFYQEVGHNHSAAEEIKKLLEAKVFDSPKPKELVMKMLKIATTSDEEDIVFDFFSGSATTAHAVMQLNAEDGGNRRFILVQLPEVCDENSEAAKAGYANICEIGKERIRRAGVKIKEDDDQWKSVPLNRADGSAVGDYTPQQELFVIDPHDGKPPIELVDISKNPDIGFRVFKLDSSNLKQWDNSPISGEDAVEQFTQRMLGMIDIIKPDRADTDVVYEVMLKLGQDLCEPICAIDIGDERQVYGVGADVTFIVCLASNITEVEAKIMAAYAPERIVFADQCFNDSTDKSNVKLTLRDRGITIRVL
jgi:adenine-specific DNA-methyltransferase